MTVPRRPRPNGYPSNVVARPPSSTTSIFEARCAHRCRIDTAGMIGGYRIAAHRAEHRPRAYAVGGLPVRADSAISSGLVSMVISIGVRGQPRCSQSLATPRRAPATDAAGTSWGNSDGSVVFGLAVGSRYPETWAAAVVRRRTYSMTRALPIDLNKLHRGRPAR